jgi:HAD superfamily hydrolase (TIGR01509 family)
MPKPLRGILFDLDGVLIDSMPFHYGAWSAAFAAVGVPVITEREVYEREGEPLEATARALYRRHLGVDASGAVVASIVAHRDRIYYERVRVILMPGAASLVGALKAMGFRLGLVTGSTVLPRSLLKRREFMAAFDAVVTRREVLRGKPAPDPYLRGLQLVGLRADQCVAVENAPLGIRSAVAAGIFCFAVRTAAVLPAELLASCGAGHVCESLQGLRTRLIGVP